ncbi:hypothetical protein EDD86DRAFT_224892 [Gorgonomyces haynaldii]|nr:hypothetical protein EDD86DRAFT_224892 [Gorgonomyces haynaldii]
MNKGIYFLPEIQDSFKAIQNASTEDWALYGYGRDNELKIVEQGTGLDNLCDEFEESKILYAFAKVTEPVSGLPKFVLISFCGDGVPVSRKGLFNYHVNDVAHFFKGYSVHIQARSTDDTDPKTIMKRVQDSSGAKYSIQQNVPNPSLAKPSYQPIKPIPSETVSRPVVSQPVSRPVVSPAPVVKPVVSQPPVVKPVQPPVSQPVQPAKAQAAQPDDSKALYQGTTSSYVPVKTNPKPLSNNIFMQKSADEEIAKQRREREEKERKERELALQEEQARLKREQAARSRVERERQEQERVDRERVERERQEQQRLEQQRQDRERQEQQQRQERERQEQQRLEQERLEQQRLERERQEQQKPTQNGTTQSATVLYDYEAGEGNEISLREGETISHIVQVDDGWWQGTNAQGKTGLFPANYVELIQETASQTAVALYDYEPTEPNELQLVAGDTITGVVPVSDGWWQGTVNGRVGLFPANYVELQN